MALVENTPIRPLAMLVTLAGRAIRPAGEAHETVTSRPADTPAMSRDRTGDPSPRDIAALYKPRIWL